MHPAQHPIDDILKDCEIRRQRRSGPGGQHRNKVETGIFITHLPTGVEANATEKRSQESNRKQAVTRLRIRLAIEHRTVDRYEPTKLWQQRCRKGRIAINPAHEDFPAILAEAIDNISWQEFDLPKAAETLKCTASQLIKLLRLDPTALNRVNNSRVDKGLRQLK